jgi:hypothetical protein
MDTLAQSVGATLYISKLLDVCNFGQVYRGLLRNILNVGFYIKRASDSTPSESKLFTDFFVFQAVWFNHILAEVFF